MFYGEKNPSKNIQSATSTLQPLLYTPEDSTGAVPGGSFETMEAMASLAPPSDELEVRSEAGKEL